MLFKGCNGHQLRVESRSCHCASSSRGCREVLRDMSGSARMLRVCFEFDSFSVSSIESVFDCWKFMKVSNREKLWKFVICHRKNVELWSPHGSILEVSWAQWPRSVIKTISPKRWVNPVGLQGDSAPIVFCLALISSWLVLVSECAESILGCCLSMSMDHHCRRCNKHEQWEIRRQTNLIYIYWYS